MVSLSSSAGSIRQRLGSTQNLLERRCKMWSLVEHYTQTNCHPIPIIFRSLQVPVTYGNQPLEQLFGEHTLSSHKLCKHSKHTYESTFLIPFCECSLDYFVSFCDTGQFLFLRWMALENHTSIPKKAAWISSLLQ